jgi:hypothetical protein
LRSNAQLAPLRAGEPWASNDDDDDAAEAADMLGDCGVGPSDGACSIEVGGLYTLNPVDP